MIIVEIKVTKTIKEKTTLNKSGFAVSITEKLSIQVLKEVAITNKTMAKKHI